MNSDDPALVIVASKGMADKAINSLKGILLGIKMDSVIHDKEKNELQQWVNAHSALIHRKPFSEFMDVINEALSDDILTLEEVEDIYWLCQKFEGESIYYDAFTSDLQILQGICHGILADGSLHEKELYQLKDWLEGNSHLNTYYPYDELRSLLLSIVADKVVDEKEKLILKAYFNQFVSLHDGVVKNDIQSEIIDIPLSGLCTSDPDVSFDGTSFCLTGKFQRGVKSDLTKEIENLGGKVVSGVSSKTDYLIVGDAGNPAWAFSCYGRKVEQAINLRKQGSNISIIHEFDFCDIIDDLIY